MTLATMADRTLPLAERVQAALLDWDMDDAHRRARAELIADVAAADRLARAAVAERRAMMAYSRAYIVGNNPAGQDTPDATKARHAVNDARAESIAAISAYRARMAQGVGRG